MNVIEKIFGVNEVGFYPADYKTGYYEHFYITYLFNEAINDIVHVTIQDALDAPNSSSQYAFWQHKGKDYRPEVENLVRIDVLSRVRKYLPSAMLDVRVDWRPWNTEEFWL